MTVTNHMLRQKIAEINQKVRYSNTASNGTHYSALDEEGTVLIVEKRITRVQGDTMICEDGTKAKLYSPMPCLHWKCLTPPDNKGISTLRKPLNGLFLDDGTNTYCLGVDGLSDEFEVRLQVGTNEVRLNNLFLNLNAPSIVKNGVETK